MNNKRLTDCEVEVLEADINALWDERIRINEEFVEILEYADRKGLEVEWVRDDCREFKLTRKDDDGTTRNS